MGADVATSRECSAERSCRQAAKVGSPAPGVMSGPVQIFVVSKISIILLQCKFLEVLAKPSLPTGSTV
jgi:hypothetical protein